MQIFKKIFAAKLNFLFLIAVTFLEYWKRYSARLAHRWDVVDVEREEIRPRPEFALKVLLLQKLCQLNE